MNIDQNSGTREQEWLKLLRDLPPWEPPELTTVVISPHPDDETLGAGGLIQWQRRRGVSVKVIAVTDGEASYPDAIGLGDMRVHEQEEALAKLGVDSRDIVRLGLPDGGVEKFADRLTTAVSELVQPNCLLVAPWELDNHPDHEVGGEVAKKVALQTGARLISYMFWAWHHAEFQRVMALPLRGLRLDLEGRNARAAALACHRSQLQWSTGNPSLPAPLLAPAQRRFETFIMS